jgi:hypothetical protein
MVQIAPWTAARGLLAGAAHVLTSDGLFFLCGPFREAGMQFGLARSVAPWQSMFTFAPMCGNQEF